MERRREGDKERRGDARRARVPEGKARREVRGRRSYAQMGGAAEARRALGEHRATCAVQRRITVSGPATSNDGRLVGMA